MLWSLDSVTLSGRRAPRLDCVSLQIPSGVTAVLGQSGAGKTSLLNLMVGFEKASAGSVTFQRSGSEGKLAVFWAPPQQGLWTHLTVREHLTTVSRKQGEAERAEADRLLAQFDLLALADAKPDSLSLGERSRVNVARALSSHAEVLVMDEPLSHVDSARSDRYWDVIREQCDRHHMSLVFSTHAPDVVLRQASHVICLSDGHVAYAGPVQELYERPASLELASLLGPCNWLSPTDMAVWCEAKLANSHSTIELANPLRGNGWPGRSGLAEAPEASQPHHAPESSDRSVEQTSTDNGYCLRPEQIEIVPAAESSIRVEKSQFAGLTSETEVCDERTGSTRRFVHHSRGATRLRQGDRVILKLLLVLLFVCGFLGCEKESSPQLVVKRETNWLMPPDGPRVPAPRGMTVSPDHEYLVLDNAGRLLVFDQNGDLQRQWWMPEYSVGKAEGVCVLKDGRIAVADTHYHRVVFFNHEGQVTGMFGQIGSDPGDFVYPVAVAQDPDENLYICEYGRNDRVQKFRPDGTFILQFGGPGTDPGQFQRPSGIVWYDHKLYVVDAFNNRIQVFTDDGKFVAILADSDRISEVHYPYDIAVDKNGDLFVVEYKAGRVSKFSREGRLLGRYGTSGPGQTLAQFSTPWGLAIDHRGRLYVCDTGNRRIVELEL